MDKELLDKLWFDGIQIVVRRRAPDYKLVRKDSFSKEKMIPLIAKIIENETSEEYCSSEIIAEEIYDLIIRETEVSSKK